VRELDDLLTAFFDSLGNHAFRYGKEEDFLRHGVGVYFLWETGMDHFPE